MDVAATIGIIVLVSIFMLGGALIPFMVNRRLSQIGIEAKGRVISVGFYKCSGRVEYELDNGETHFAGFNTWSRFITYKKNDIVTILYDPKDYENIIIKSVISS